MLKNLFLSGQALPDYALIRRIQQLARAESRLTAILVLHLAEFDARRLYLREGCPSLFVYCNEVLQLSEQAAYNRIVAARLVRRFPAIQNRLMSGSVHLAAIRLLAPVMTDENHLRLLDSARGKPKRLIEVLVAEERIPEGKADSTLEGSRRTPSELSGVTGDLFEIVSGDAREESGASAEPETRCLSAPIEGMTTPALTEVGPITTRPDRDETEADPSPCKPDGLKSHPHPEPRRARITPLSRNCFRLQITLDAETLAILRQAQELLLHQIPRGDLSRVIHRALEKLVKDLLRKKCGTGRRRSRERCAAASSAAGSSRRHIPVAVREEVWQRDGGRCAFISESGRRCSERGRLEFHHVTPFARGGAATIENIQLRCRAHNQHEAEIQFGSVRRRKN